MNIKDIFLYPKSLDEAKGIQKNQKHQVVREDKSQEVNSVAGIDVGFRDNYKMAKKVKPIYVSIGHKISLPTALDYVMACLTKYRLPETTRWADKLASDK